MYFYTLKVPSYKYVYRSSRTFSSLPELFDVVEGIIRSSRRQV